MWVLVANSSIARIFSAPAALGGLNEIESYSHSASRALDQELNADRPGRTFDSMGSGRHAKEATVSPKEEEAVRFAEQLAARLDEARAKGDLDALMIVAAPRFLGLLRQKLDPVTRDIVSLEIDQDLTRLAAKEIRKRLPERLYSDL